jgi:hypothetical protein
VRCVRCTRTWHQAPPPDTIPAEPRPIPVYEEIREDTAGLYRPQLPAIRQPPPRFGKVQIGWAALGAVVVAIAVCLALFRENLVDLWPPMARLYAAIGWPMPPPWAGLELHTDKPDWTMIDGKRVCVFTGQVSYTGTKPKPVPKIRLTLVSKATQKTMLSVDGDPADATLAPGGSTGFRIAVVDPPDDVAASVAFDYGDPSAQNR